MLRLRVRLESDMANIDDNPIVIAEGSASGENLDAQKMFSELTSLLQTLPVPQYGRKTAEENTVVVKICPSAKLLYDRKGR